MLTCKWDTDRYYSHFLYQLTNWCIAFNISMPLYQWRVSACVVLIGLPVLKHVLMPRSKAVRMCVDQLRERLDAIYDVTIAYSSTRKESDGLVTRTSAPTLSSKKLIQLIGRILNWVKTKKLSYIIYKLFVSVVFRGPKHQTSHKKP